MPRKNFYIPESDLEYYEKAKEYAGESLSSILVQCLKNIVRNKEIQENQMEMISIFIGESDGVTHSMKGERIKFVGKKIATDYYDSEPNTFINYSLYYTRKGKYLLYVVYEDTAALQTEFSYKVYDSFSALYNANLTVKLINEAEKFFGKLSDIPSRELDI